MDAGEGGRGLGMQTLGGMGEMEGPRTAECLPGPGWMMWLQEEKAGRELVSGGGKIISQAKLSWVESCKGEVTWGRSSEEYTGLRLRGTVRNGTRFVGH